jgi:hypothetical protein
MHVLPGKGLNTFVLPEKADNMAIFETGQLSIFNK